MQMCQIDKDSLRIVENTQIADTAVAAAAHKSAGTKVRSGVYDTFLATASRSLSYRPYGGAIVTESTGLIRPPAVALVLPQSRLSADTSEVDLERGKPVDIAVGSAVFPDPDLTAGEEHGLWLSRPRAPSSPVVQRRRADSQWNW